ITAANRGPEPALLHLLPTLWFRNTWSWGRTHEGYWPKRFIHRAEDGTLVSDHVTLGPFRLAVSPLADGAQPVFLFTENETNVGKLYGIAGGRRYVKDAFHDYVIGGRGDAVTPEGQGTKAAAHYHLLLPPGEQVTLQLRLYAEEEAPPQAFGPDFDRV